MERELYPARDEYTTEMSMSDYDDISVTNTLLEKQPVFFLDFVDDSVNSFCHLICAFSSRAARLYHVHLKLVHS